MGHPRAGSPGRPVCAETIEAFRTERFAVTRAGQVRADGRHEKDDRHAVDDRTRWVLGWSNADKIDALLARGRLVQEPLTDIDASLRTLRTRADVLRDRRGALDKLSVFAWPEIDWQTSVCAISRFEQERRSLEATSNSPASPSSWPRSSGCLPSSASCGAGWSSDCSLRVWSSSWRRPVGRCPPGGVAEQDHPFP